MLLILGFNALHVLFIKNEKVSGGSRSNGEGGVGERMSEGEKYLIFLLVW
jgi:hypothetical protein